MNCITKYNLPKMTPDEIQNLNRLISKEENPNRPFSIQQICQGAIPKKLDPDSFIENSTKL